MTFSGFTVTQAVGEGIFAFSLGTELEHLTISGNAILSDDRGIGGLNTTYFQCEPPDEGDCGEGIHFSGVAYSQVTGNKVAGNAGGILLTDDTGPTDHNLVSGNLVSDLDGTPYMPHTGILVFSAGTPVTIAIVANHISDDVNGIFLSKPVTATGLNSNSFTNVTTPVFSGG